MSKLQKLLDSFEKDDDGWMYYGNVSPEEAEMEYSEMKKRITTLTRREKKMRDILEFDEITGDCLLGCGGCVADGHSSDCLWMKI